MGTGGSTGWTECSFLVAASPPIPSLNMMVGALLEFVEIMTLCTESLRPEPIGLRCGMDRYESAMRKLLDDRVLSAQSISPLLPFPPFACGL